MKWLDFKITQRCNNQCVYCGVNHASPHDQNILDAPTIQKTITQAINANFTHFAFLGGEPSLRDDFKYIMEPFQGKRARNVEEIMIITNMIQPNLEMVTQIFQTEVKSAILTASIDKLTSPNFKHQNPGKILEYLSNIQALAQNYQTQGNRGIHVHSVISRENFTNIVSLVQYFWNRGISVSLAIVEPYLLTENPQKYNEFSRAEIKAILKQLDILDYHNQLNWANRVLRDYINHFVLNNSKHFTTCRAGRLHVIIEFDGNVYPCLTESYRQGCAFGNILKEDFTSIYQKMQQFQCQEYFHQTCWDHYLWSRLAQEGGS